MKTILVDAINAFIIKESGIFKEMYDLLEMFPNKKIILTSADEEQRNKFGLNNVPYKLFTLEHNPEKTDLEYYQKMLEHFNLKSGDVIYFEHDLEAVESARKNNILTHYYDKDKKDLKALKEFLENNL